MNTACRDFGRRLRSQRERCGIDLEAIAASTKIKGSLLADLERGDVSKWPRGIFRRAFIRDYAGMIGLSPDLVFAEFFELFPEDGASRTRSAGTGSGLRLTIVEDRDAERRAAAGQAFVAIVEVAVLSAVGAAAAWLTPMDLLSACGGIALAYYPVAAAVCGRTPALKWLHDKRSRVATPAEEAAPSGPADLIRMLLPQPPSPRVDAEAARISGAAASEIQVASR
jgi:transcriptional regulator with XRE-family HTH domain